MKKAITTAFALAALLTVQAQELNVNTDDARFSTGSMDWSSWGMGRVSFYRNGIPVKEVSSFRHEGNDLVIDLADGASYTTDVTKVTTMSSTMPEDMLAFYPTLKKLKTFNKIDELDEGELIGIFAEKSYTFEEYYNATYSIFGYMLEQLGTILQTSLEGHLDNLARMYGITREDIKFHTADILYVGLDIDGKKIPMSGRLLYPYSTNPDKPIKLSNIYTDNHVSIFTDNGEPSKAFSMYSPHGQCTRGYLVVQPDLLGFGPTKHRTQMYVDNDLNGRFATDCIRAAVEYCNLTTTAPQSYTYAKLRDEATVINTGASQGASVALATTYYMENVLDNDVANGLPKVSETRTVGGAYNLRNCLDFYVNNDSLSFSFTIPMMIASGLVAHKDVFVSSNGKTQYTIHDFFDPALQTRKWSVKADPAMWQFFEYDATLWQMLDGKLLGSAPMEACLQSWYPCDAAPKRASFLKMISQDLLTTGFGGKKVLNMNNDKTKALLAYCDMNNLSDHKKWVPRSTVVLTHGVLDDVVPYSCALSFYNEMRPYAGNRIILEPLTGKLEFASMGGATSSAHGINVMLWTVAELVGPDTFAAKTALLNYILQLLAKVADDNGGIFPGGTPEQVKAYMQMHPANGGEE